MPRREVERSDGENFAKEYNAYFVETSTVTREGINQVFDLSMNNIIKELKMNIILIR